MEFSSLFFNVAAKKNSHFPNVISIKPSDLIASSTHSATSNSSRSSSEAAVSVAAADYKNSSSLTRCQKCDAVLTCESHYYYSTKKEQSSQSSGLSATSKTANIWQCDYCGHGNSLTSGGGGDLSMASVPGNNVDVLMNASSSDKSESSYFIFCVDVSNSMSEKSDVSVTKVFFCFFCFVFNLDYLFSILLSLSILSRFRRMSS